MTGDKTYQHYDNLLAANETYAALTEAKRLSVLNAAVQEAANFFIAAKRPEYCKDNLGTANELITEVSVGDSGIAVDGPYQPENPHAVAFASPFSTTVSANGDYQAGAIGYAADGVEVHVEVQRTPSSVEFIPDLPVVELHWWYRALGVI